MSFFVYPQENDWGEITYQFTTAGYIGLVLIMLALLLLGAAVFGGKKKEKMPAKQLAFSAVAIALAMVTSMIKIFHMPMGGSVTLFSMLFIVLIGYWYGLSGGLTAAIAYGILQMLLDPYILSVPQMLVDYIFAFGALGLAGLFSNSGKYGLIKGYIVAVLGRYFFAVLSGVIFFGSYAEGTGFSGPLTYSLAYNGAYLAAEAAITIVVLLMPPVKKALTSVEQMA